MKEKVKRLAPNRTTLRELYLKSGNQCAFPGCRKSLFNNKGVFVGQVCHIEAAEKGGPRFNRKQTNEERRLPENLLLLCYDHHVETDDIEKFPVRRMREIKKAHEEKYSDVIGAIEAKIVDHTTLSSPKRPKNLIKLSKICNWGKLKSDDLNDSISELNKMISRLSKLPIPSREFLTVLISRSHLDKTTHTLQVSPPEVQQATGINISEIRELFSILDRYDFIGEGDENEFGVMQVAICTLKSGWDIWSDLLEFCKKTKITLTELVVDLHFSLLDS